jgi:hypothetical protein
VARRIPAAVFLWIAALFAVVASINAKAARLVKKGIFLRIN